MLNIPLSLQSTDILAFGHGLPRFSVCLALICISVSSNSITHGQSTTSQLHAASKKGLQVEDVADALKLGISHATLNLNLNQLISPTEVTSVHWDLDSKRYYFDENYVGRLDRQVQELSAAGVTVYLILLVYQSGNPDHDRVLCHPNASLESPNRLAAFNTVSTEGRLWLQASVEFLAHRWSSRDQTKQGVGGVRGWIVGNEVNSHWFWCNMGRTTMAEFADAYERAVRIVQLATTKHSPDSRVYISLEHHWNMRYPGGDQLQAFHGRDFLQLFNQLVRSRGDFSWHVAYHPYPENLFDPKFWADESALPTDDTPRITFRNLDVLTDYLGQPDLQYQQRTRRVILSEQGFHSSGTEASEITQAAAYCYAYRLVAANRGIDAFILHRHIDHPHEGGLNLGLRRRANATSDASFDERFPPKPIWECFKFADTEQWPEYFRFALPIAGLDRWPGETQLDINSNAP